MIIYVVGNGDEAIPMLQYESVSARLSPRPAAGISGPDVTVTSSCPAANKHTSSPTNQLRVQVSAPDDGTIQHFSTGVVNVAAESNPGNSNPWIRN